MHFYTDASIKNNQLTSPNISIAQLSESLNIKFNAAISSYPDISRNELEAIIYLLLAIPANSNIQIHLDNNTAINSLQQPPTTLIKTKNWDTIYIINQFKKQKNINFILHKVKSHLTNSFHNQVDLLAKQGCHKTKIILNTDLINFTIFFTWNNLLIPQKI